MTNEAAIEDLLQAAISAHQIGRLDEAEARYSAVLAGDPDNAQALRLRGVLSRQRGRVRESVGFLERAVQLSPEDATAANDLALSLMACGDLRGADIALRAALGSAPDSPRALANLGALLQQRGHLAEAISVHEHYLELIPDDLEVRCNLANALMDAGRGEDSIAACDAALALAPGHPLVLASKGAVLVGLERFAEAAEVLRQALDDNPDDEMALINLAFAARALGEGASAIEILTQAVRLSPDNARAAADLANALLSAGQVDRAIAACERFLAIHRGERLVLATYGYALGAAGRVDESRRIFDYDNLVRIRDIDAPHGFANLDEFNDGLESFVTTHASLLDDPVRKATTGGAQTGELDALESPVFAAFASLVRRQIEKTILELRVEGFSKHEVMAYESDLWTLRTWGTVLSPGGSQAPHQHPLAWLSGVYYVSLPAETDVGLLEFGAPPERIGLRSEPDLRTVTPRPGRLVVFPSWFYHRTQPFTAGLRRISIAFDVMPLAAGD